MKPIPVPPDAKVLNSLLRKARRRSIVLEAADGQRFVLAAVDHWESYPVGASEDFAVEVRRTARSKRLAQVMAKRRADDAGAPRLSLEQVKKELGLK
jgi:hypothetical protein